MKVFNKSIEKKKLNMKKNKDTYIKRLSISLSCLILLFIVVLFTFAKFETSSEEYTLINGKIFDASSGDVVLSYKVDGVSQGTPPAKGSGYKFKSIECTNGDGTWLKDEWGVKVVNLTGKAKCNLEFESMTSAIMTVYSAAEDQLYYYDGSDKIVIGTTDSTGKLESASIELGEQTIYSSVAKNPDSVSNYYSQEVTIDEDSEELYLMPNNGNHVIYWFGYTGDVGLNINIPYSRWANCSGEEKPTVNTNNIDIYSTRDAYCSTLYTSSMINTTRVYSMIQGIQGVSGVYGYFYISDSAYYSNNYSNITNSTLAKNSYTINQTNRNIIIGSASGRKTKLFALWYD